METVFQQDFDDLTTRVGTSTLEKITKILAMTEAGRSTEAESNIAMNMALSLLAKHNLSMDDINTYSLKDEILDMESVESGTKENFTSWRSNLLRAISDSHFCYMYRDVNKKCYALTGKKTNREAAIILYHYLSSVIEEETRRALSEYTGWESGKSFANSFRIGMVDRISNRLYEQKKQITKTAIGDGTDIAVYDPYEKALKENQAFVKSKGINLVMRRASSSGYSGAGYSRGREAGANVGLNAGRSLPRK